MYITAAVSGILNRQVKREAVAVKIHFPSGPRTGYSILDQQNGLISIGNLAKDRKIISVSLALVVIPLSALFMYHGFAEDTSWFERFFCLATSAALLGLIYMIHKGLGKVFLVIDANRKEVIAKDIGKSFPFSDLIIWVHSSDNIHYADATRELQKADASVWSVSLIAGYDPKDPTPGFRYQYMGVYRIGTLNDAL